MSGLSAELFEYLQAPRPVLVTTLDADSKGPYNSLISWVLAIDADTIRLAADGKGHVMGNIRADGRTLLTLLTQGTAFAVEGQAVIRSEELPGVSLKLACAELKISAVREIMFWGGKLVAEPAFDVTYDKALKEKLDTGVLAGMKSL